MSFEAKARAKETKRLYEQVRGKIEKVNEQYKLKANKSHRHPKFKPGDLVWLHFRKERFPSRRKNMHIARGDGLYKVV